MRCYITALLLVASYCLNATDIGGILRGKVIDNGSGNPLSGVYVIYGKNLGTTTDQDGAYLIQDVSGKIKITFQFIGYISVTREVVVNEGETTVLDVSLDVKVSEMDQVVVSANRTEQKIAELSVSMDIIKTPFLSGNHITDAQELINKNPGIEVVDGQASVRGGSGYSYGAGSRVLALIDGLPFNSADAGNIKWQFLPLENLSQVEIIKGASSVLYGSSALNGIINFRTADATNTPVTRFFVEAGIFGKPRNRDWVWWDTPRFFTTTSISHLQKFGKTDLGISGNLTTDEGYRRLNGENLGRINLKLKHFSSKVEGLNYGLNISSGFTHKKDFLLWENAETGALKQNESTAAEFHGDFISVDPFISLKKADRFSHDLRMRFHSARNRLPDREQNNSDAISLYSEYLLRYRLSEFLDLTAGFSENYSKVRSNFFGDHHSLNLAGFTQLEMRPVNRLKAVAGLRIENYSLDGVNEKIVPIFRAGLNWQGADYTYLRASFGQGYRFPSIAEKYASTTLGSIHLIPNPDILSESGWNAEVGVKQGFMLGKITGQADLSLFLMNNSNLIEFYFGLYSEGLGFRADNLEEARVYGTELEFGLNRQVASLNISATGGYTYIYPVDKSAINNENVVYLKHRRKHSGKLYINTQWKKLDLGLNINIRSKVLNIDDVFLNIFTREAILPGFYDYWQEDNKGYMTIDAIPGYHISDRFTLSFAVKNLTNTEYMGRPGDIQPQRNYSLRISGKFPASP
jgi:iron complex outermembrane receptor protein